MITATDTFEIATEMLNNLGFKIVSQDKNKPWGGFFVIDESQAQQFASHFFPAENFEGLKIANKLSPKLLMVAPGKRLSWQYHYRRAEIWRCVEGNVEVVTSLTDEESERHQLSPGDVIKLEQGERHRLIGTSEWGVVAEIWRHTDDAHPSDENDIVRLQDDYGR